MRTSVFISFLTVAFTTTAAPVEHVKRRPVGICPPIDPVDRSVYLPDSKNCNEFYECTNGIPKLFTCPDGLEYNAVLQVCDWPQNVICPGKILPLHRE